MYCIRAWRQLINGEVQYIECQHHELSTQSQEHAYVQSLLCDQALENQANYVYTKYISLYAKYLPYCVILYNICNNL